jgi:lysophospholipase L1-like esterase
MRAAAFAMLLGCIVVAASDMAPAAAADTNAAAPGETNPGQACPANRVSPIDLPKMRSAVSANREVTIVALGSSSTEGWRASNIAHSYPALLQADLNAALPTADIAVINRGVGGEDVAEELPRIEPDALALKPTLVIWQVGANGAMRHMPPELFKRLLTAGVKRLLAARVDVLLMDNQKAPAILASPEHVAIEQAMADVAAETGVKLFARGALMDQWREAGYPYERFVSDDGVHHNDYGYRCVTAALSDAIVQGINMPDATTTQTAAKR